MNDFWKYVRPDPEGLEANPFIHPDRGVPVAPASDPMVRETKRIPRDLTKHLERNPEDMAIIPEMPMSPREEAEILERLLLGEPYTMLTAELLVLLEGIIRGAVPGNYPTDWNEDFITRSLLKSLRSDLGHVLLVDQPDRLEIKWRAWKQVGKAEHTFGDVAVLVNIRTRGVSKPLEGVGFLEAKRRYPPGGFDELRPAQLQRIVALAPHAALLLYDFAPVAVNPVLAGRHPFQWPGWRGGVVPEAVRRTYAVTVAQDLALAVGTRDASLYRFALPFSQQLVGRYFCGLDLEFSRAALDAAQGQNRDVGAPRYLVVAAIGRGVTPGEIDVNTNLFRDLADSEETG